MPKIGYRSVALLVGAALISLTIVAFLMIRSAQHTHIETLTQTNIRLFSVKLESRMREQLMVANLFSDQLENTRMPLAERFKINVGAIFPLLPDLEAVNWVNTDGIVEVAYPATTANKILSQKLGQREDTLVALYQARTSREPRLSAPFQLAQGGIGFEGFVPVFQRGEISGFIQFVFRAGPLINSVIGPWQGQGFIVAVADGDGLVYGNLPLLSGAEHAGSSRVTVAGRIWDLAIAPTEATLKENLTLLDELVLAGGALMSLLASMLVVCSGRTQDAIRDSEERFSLAMQGASDGLYDRDLRTNEVYYSPQWFRMLGYEPDEFPHGMDTAEQLIHPDDWPKLVNEIDRLMKAGEPHFEHEMRMRHSDGSWRTILSRAFMVFKNGRATRLVGTNIDLTEDRVRERALKEATRTDHLTGLRNRRELRRDLTTIFYNLHKRDRLCVFHLDLDRFKAINDTDGHQVGDAALCEVARRLRALDTDFDIIARVGGDEFVLVRAGSDTDDEIRAIASKIMQRIADPFSAGGKQIRLGASVGVAFAQGGSGGDIRDTLENADIALIHAKDEGRGRCRFFTHAMRQEAVRRARMQHDITLGLQRNEFIAHFQPQVDMETGRIIGFEALARWDHPDRGILSAGEFISHINSSSLAIKLDRAILRQACRLLPMLAEAGRGDITVSVNISAEQLSEADIARKLGEIVRQAGADPARLHLEILETTLLEDASPVVIENIRELAARGFRIELDDFGTGHTAISSVLNFPISRIKIAGSLVAGVDQDTRRKSIIHSIVELGENLGVDVLAEGMETASEVAFLKSISCRVGQGFHLDRPLSVAELLERIKPAASPSRQSDLELSD
ncbi:bifunctional diguanylate cyclase/phosphodiesterase [Amaricoccus tamworthensis]|uniref:bifunctional diguanylate cyclase/phosphodiesterase n=1 Tax=Amaricoccus tamworthensis TaxID=57002 RepID=UPI003C7C9ED5